MKNRFNCILFLMILSCIFSSAYAETQIDLDEYGVSLIIPYHHEWIARINEEVIIHGESFDANRDDIIRLMESENEYVFGIDPTSDLYFNLRVLPAAETMPNFSFYSDEEIIENSREMLLKDGNVFEDFYVYTTPETKFSYTFIEKESFEQTQYVYLCLTSVNDTYYLLKVQGSQSGYVETMALFLMENMVFEKITIENLTRRDIGNTGLSISIPEGWTEDILYGEGPYVYYNFEGKNNDGSVRIIGCEIMDLCEAFGYAEAMRPALGESFAKILVFAECDDDGIDVSEVRKYTFGDHLYYAYPKQVNGSAMVSMKTVENGYSYTVLLYMPSIEDPFEDEFFPLFEEIMKSVSF